MLAMARLALRFALLLVSVVEVGLRGAIALALACFVVVVAKGSCNADLMFTRHEGQTQKSREILLILQPSSQNQSE